MIRGLFVTFEGLSPTIADSQVLVHLSEMRNYGIDIELWTFATKRSIYDQSATRLRNNPEMYAGVKLFRAFPAILPGSELFNAFILYFLMWNQNLNVRFVHARTDYSAVVCGIVNFIKRVELIWDCRGDTQAEFVLTCDSSSWFRRLVSPIQRVFLAVRTRLAEVLCDKAIFVSKKLKIRRTTSTFSKPFEIIPCVASSQIFYFNEDLRNNIRNYLGVDSCHRLIVYSGSLGGYQIFDKCIDLFLKLAENDESLILLVLTPYLDQAKVFLRTVPENRYRLLAVPFHEVNGYLNAADFGLFLREFNSVNDVASPIKFSEYCLAGLPVIMTNAVDQSADIARILGNGIFYDFHEVPSNLKMLTLEARCTLSRNGAYCLSRDAVAVQYQKLYIGENL